MVLELTRDEPVAGSLLAGDGRARGFTGWMELVAALQSALDGEAPPGDRDVNPLSHGGRTAQETVEEEEE